MALASVTRIGVVFPGQGSQQVGMGRDLNITSPTAAKIFARSNELLGYDLLGLMIDGPDETLRETRYSQPAIYVINHALCAAVGDALQPVVSAGHSFGEFCSLTIAGAIAFDEALRLVDERAKAMHAAAELAVGGMTAILGLAPELVRAAVDEASAGGRVRMANFNAPGQIVVSGDLAAVERAAELALVKGAKRVVPLNVSGAWHSELMAPAGAQFAAFVDRAAIGVPRFAVVSNVDAQIYRDVMTIKRNLVRSVTDEVRWHETALALIGEGLDLVVEFGASPVLAPLMKRLPNAPTAIHVGDAAGVERLRAKLGAPELAR
ncbi:MAG: ACP S-malonyltransferase [Vulcanimicrobiaceae bacterium]